MVTRWEAMESARYHGIRASVNPAAFEEAENGARLNTVSFMLTRHVGRRTEYPPRTTLD